MNKTVNVFHVIAMCIVGLMAVCIFTYVNIVANQQETIKIQDQSINELKQHIEWQDSIINIYHDQIMNLQYMQEPEK